MVLLPNPKTLPTGPSIIYCSATKKPQLVKFVYCMPVFRKNAYKLVIEYTCVEYYEKYLLDNEINTPTFEYINKVYKTQYETKC
tara:strand:- start:150 stop:401 length:252 start_codon:yes stop_codon:yes gene_type:complete